MDNKKINKIARKIMADEKIIEDEEGNQFSLDELKQEYEQLKRDGQTQAATFQDYLTNITDHNGTCEWIHDDFCVKCLKRTDDTFVTVDGVEHICWNCAEEMAQEAKEQNREIEIEMGPYYEPCYLCSWCEQLYPENELKKEHDLGYLCDWCIDGILSRGEHLNLEY